MNREEFAMEVNDRIKPYLSEEIRNAGELKVHKQLKVNDMMLYGIRVDRAAMLPSPVIYLEEFYESYQKGQPMELVLSEIADTFDEAWKKNPVIGEFSLTPDEVEKRVVCRIVSIKMNQNLLRDMKHTPIGNGYALTYHIEITDEASIPLTRELARMEGLDMRLIHEAAVENTKNKYPAVLQDMRSKLFMQAFDFENNNLLNTNEVISDSEIYVLSNQDGRFGATTMFYPGIKDKIGELLGMGYYAIPSSRHEFLIVPKSNEMSATELQNMLRTVNKEAVAPEDVLSDKVLEYSKENRTLKIAEPDKDHERGR